MRSRGRGASSYSRSPRSFAPTAGSGPLPDDKKLNEGLIPQPLKTIPIPLPVAEQVSIKDLQFLGSYNWIADETTPTIIVPGSPAEWQNKPTPYQVPADRGNSFNDQNGYRMPKAVLQPLITAVDIHQADVGQTFDWSSVDIVTDRNGLRKLLRWIAGSGGRVEEARPFRVDLQLAGKKTVLFNRWEKRYREAMSGFTFGFNFEKASTLPGVDCDDATAHHRIVCYNLNGLKLVVRFEVDAYMPAPAPKASSRTSVDDITSKLANVNIAKAKSLPKSTSHGLTVLKGGNVVPQSSIIELSTLSQKRRDVYDWKELYPQLFLSQTQHHFLALHDRGRFVAIEKRELGSSTDLVSVAKDLQRNLRRLRAALGEIQKLAIEHGERGRISLVCEGGTLQVFVRASQDGCLPDEFMARFE